MTIRVVIADDQEVVRAAFTVLANGSAATESRAAR